MLEKKIYFTKQKCCNYILFGVKPGIQLVKQVSSALINTLLFMAHAQAVYGTCTG